MRRTRARLCLEWYAREAPGHRKPSRLSLALAGWTLGSVGRAAARAARSNRDMHTGALDLIDAMIAVGGRPAVALETASAVRGAAPYEITPN